MRRIFKLYIQYWIVLTLIFIPLNFSDLDGENVAYNIIGIKHNLHYFNWFLLVCNVGFSCFKASLDGWFLGSTI